MKLAVKTLKGEKFSVEVEPSNKVVEVKGIIEGEKSELPAANMKLIHSGKVLKDDDTIESCNIKPNDFLVVMVTKTKKPAAAAPAAAAASAPVTPSPAAAAAEATPAATASDASNPPPAPARPDPPAADDFPAEVVSNLTGMGFPEAEVRACLRASHGNPDVAVEFLTNGIPAAAQQQPASSSGGSSSSGGPPLQALREHPQFDDLRRLVQSNPQMLQAVLTQIGQQSPALLEEINANQARFLEMMNEPLTDAPSGSSRAPSAPTSSSGTSGTSPQNLAGALGGMGNPGEMAQLLQNMNPNELNEMAAMMGLSPEQLQAAGRMIGQIPPEQLQEYMMQAMQSGGMSGMMGGGGGGAFQPQVLRLSEEEMAAVDRLTEMGFDRSEAAQAFLACDKNEALAANLLMDSAGQDGGAFGFGDSSGDADSGNGGDADGDDMYE